MKNVLLTGGSGFVGKNVLPILDREYNVFAPGRQKLDLKNADDIQQYIFSKKIDVIVHSANPNPVKSFQHDSSETMFEDSLRIFMNLYKISGECEKMIYLGSGAEYDKTQDICSASEEEIGQSLPQDVYGFSKYIMNELAKDSKNIYNLRVFACYGPFDHESKFITHVIRCCMKNEEVTIRQNCWFDYLHVFDLGRTIAKVIKTDMRYHDYNIASGNRVQLKEIAEIVCQKMRNNKPIRIAQEGWNKEYTASIDRLETELHIQDSFVSLNEGIDMQIVHEKEQIK